MDKVNEKWRPYVKYKYDPLQVGSIDGTDTEIHDNGISRALNVKYKPNQKVIGDSRCTLFIGRLSPHTDEDSIMKVFKKYGPITRCRLIRDIVSGYSKCYAFIEFADEEVAYKAVMGSDYLEIDGQTVLVDFECERKFEGWVPRRLGGGFGGKKESGQLRFGGKDRPFLKPYSKLEGQDRSNQNFRKNSHQSNFTRNKDSSYYPHNSRGNYEHY